VLGDGFKHQTDSHNLKNQLCQFEFLMMFPGGFLSNPSTLLRFQTAKNRCLSLITFLCYYVGNRWNTKRMRGGVSGSDIQICSFKCGTVIADCQRIRRMLFVKHPIICLFNIVSLLASLVRFLQYYEQLSLQIKFTVCFFSSLQSIRFVVGFDPRNSFIEILRIFKLLFSFKLKENAHKRMLNSCF